MEKGISVIIPTYNREQFITEAVQSVLDQDYEGHLEILVCDDGSTDNTLKIVDSFKSKVTLLKKPFNCKTQGASSTRNRGIRASTQSFICFLDSDDVYLPNHLKKMILAFENNPEIGFAFCRSLEFKIENNIKQFRPWTRERILDNDIKNPVVSRSNIVNTNCFLFKKEVFDRIGLFNEAYSNGEDGDQWMRISEQFKGKFVDHFGTAYRTHHEIAQLTKNSDIQKKEMSFLIFEDAERRYYYLRLNDQKRIFRIKYVLLWMKHRNTNQVTFLLKYLILSVQYPIGFFQQLLICFMKKNKDHWGQLEIFDN